MFYDIIHAMKTTHDDRSALWLGEMAFSASIGDNSSRIKVIQSDQCFMQLLTGGRNNCATLRRFFSLNNPRREITFFSLRPLPTPSQ